MEQTAKELQMHKVIAIARGLRDRDYARLADALFRGGVRFLECTFDQAHPESHGGLARILSSLSDGFAGRLTIGAGTVTTTALVELAAGAGAKFIVSPDSNEAVIRRTKEMGLLSIPGAATPTEILAAHRWGADFVKVFPAGELGAGYIKAIRSPLNHVRLLAVGGIDEGNCRAFTDAGCAGVGIGGRLTNAGLLQGEDLGGVVSLAKQIVALVGG
ncbi:MAG: 2-dehydro-3-deoxyphosphogluconate aldolase [Lachnospiraceae bacterium]|nr:2-dehydro-3-deoxyphosphogluconate aldolase [Lachnospiraceae bacterium]